MPLTDRDIIEPLDTSSNPLVPEIVPSDLVAEDNFATKGNSSNNNLGLAFAAIDREYTSPSKGFSINSPIPSVSMSERYANERYPNYNPDIDNEEYAAINQSWLTQLGHSTVKFGARAASSFVESFLTWPAALSAAKSGDLSKIYNSPFQIAVENWNENIEKKFPNYISNWEQEHPYLSFLPFVHGGIGFANAWGEKVLILLFLHKNEYSIIFTNI